MLKKNEIFPWKDILLLNDQQFCEKMNIPLEVLKNKLNYKNHVFYRI